MPGGALNLLYDLTATMKFSTTAGIGDVGGGEAFDASATTFKVDKITWSEQRDSPDHSTAQDAAELPRVSKFRGTVTIETKLYDQPLMAKLAGASGKVLAQLIVTSTRSGFGATFEGIITQVDVDFDKPSTLKMTMQLRAIPVFA